MPNTLNIYRFFTASKVSSMRLLLYVILGLVLSETWHPVLFVYDVLFVFGGILFASALNDYFDFKLQGEENGIGALLSSGKVTKKQVPWLIWLPCLLPFGLFYPMLRAGASSHSMIMLSISFFLSLFYCSPPIRLKEKAFLGIITPPIGIYLLFLQAVVLVKLPTPTQWGVCALVFLFSWYLDFLHLADDAISEGEVPKLSATHALTAARITAAIGILVASAFIHVSYFGILSVFFWSTRLCAIWQITPTDLKEQRKRISSRIYCIEEFAVYGAAAVYVITMGT